MTKIKFIQLVLVLVSIVSVLLSGCNRFSPAKKPETGPAGKPVETSPNPPLKERFGSPPGELYDMEATAGVIFEGVNQKDWHQCEKGLSTLQTLWQQTKPLVGSKKGVKDADEALSKLSMTIAERNVDESYQGLNKLMSSIGEVGKSYKLSPLSDIISVDNAIRNVSFYAADKNWSKAASKTKELEDNWGGAKPSMEQIGILGEVTITHSLIKQVKDAVNAENNRAVEDHVANLNKSMGHIRDFYWGR